MPLDPAIRAARNTTELVDTPSPLPRGGTAITLVSIAEPGCSMSESHEVVIVGARPCRAVRRASHDLVLMGSIPIAVWAGVACSKSTQAGGVGNRLSSWLPSSGSLGTTPTTRIGRGADDVSRLP